MNRNNYYRIDIKLQQNLELLWRVISLAPFGIYTFGFLEQPGSSWIDISCKAYFMIVLHSDVHLCSLLDNLLAELKFSIAG